MWAVSRCSSCCEYALIRRCQEFALAPACALLIVQENRASLRIPVTTCSALNNSFLVALTRVVGQNSPRSHRGG
jgi:hypothetical protein